jgi:hypothetical protein
MARRQRQGSRASSMGSEIGKLEELGAGRLEDKPRTIPQLMAAADCRAEHLKLIAPRTTRRRKGAPLHGRRRTDLDGDRVDDEGQGHL